MESTLAGTYDIDRSLLGLSRWLLSGYAYFRRYPYLIVHHVKMINQLNQMHNLRYHPSLSYAPPKVTFMHLADLLSTVNA